MKIIINISLAWVCAINIISNLNAQTKTEVLILGTIHLNQINNLEESALVSVLKKLEQYNFDAIGIENMPTELLNDIVSRGDSTYSGLIRGYANRRLSVAEKFQKQLGMNFIQVQKKINTLLSQNLSATEDRVSLIRYFLASGDLASAVLQHSYIDKNAKIEDQFIDKETISSLEQLSGSSNEIYSIAIKLAKLLKHQKVEYIDNLQDEPLLLEYFPQFISDYTANQELFKNVSNSKVFAVVDSLKTEGVKEKDLLPVYEYMNGLEFQQADYEAQWEIWLKTNFSSKSDLSRYSLWEMRNLQITANIMKTAAFYPGKRILIIIGGSHKSFIEKYLKQSPSIKILKF